MYTHKTAAIAQMCVASTERSRVWNDRREALRQLLDVLETLRSVGDNSPLQLQYSAVCSTVQSAVQSAVSLNMQMQCNAMQCKGSKLAADAFQFLIQCLCSAGMAMACCVIVTAGGCGPDCRGSLPPEHETDGGSQQVSLRG
jgi:hypothetical protein